MPVLVSGSEDQSYRIWNINTFKLEDSRSLGMDALWDIVTIASKPNLIALGCEEGTVVLSFGSDYALASFK